VDARERWQALQSRLTAARTALEHGDRDRARIEVEAALAIDPSFLAAAALRERILGSEVPSSAIPGSRVQNAKIPEPAARSPLTSAAPLVSTEGYAKFEQRARRRRVDRKIDAATCAMSSRNLRAAAAALDEVIELDPNLPELSGLTAAFDELRRAGATTHRGPAVAAGLAFGALVLGASWVEEGRELVSHPIAAIANLVETHNPEPLSPIAVDTPVQPVPLTAIATSGRDEDLAPSPVSTPRPLVVVAPLNVPPSPTIVPTPVAPVTSARAPVPAMPTPPPVVIAATDVPRPSPSPLPRVDSDETQISHALQQYRTAYDRLDAGRAQAVWPGVNESALARAFANLESQTLTFNACRTDLRGDEAVATCQGSARYVPKIGSREPRVESRTWTFALKRAGEEWKIETARVER
jgi:hypothetical protein